LGSEFLEVEVSDKQQIPPSVYRLITVLDAIRLIEYSIWARNLATKVFAILDKRVEELSTPDFRNFFTTNTASLLGYYCM
jgi:hypothetical protein